MSQLLHESSKKYIFIIKVLNSYNHPMSNGAACQMMLGQIYSVTINEGTGFKKIINT